MSKLDPTLVPFQFSLDNGNGWNVGTIIKGKKLNHQDFYLTWKIMGAQCLFCVLKFLPLHWLLTFLTTNTNIFNSQIIFWSSNFIEFEGVFHGNKSNMMPNKQNKSWKNMTMS